MTPEEKAAADKKVTDDAAAAAAKIAEGDAAVDEEVAAIAKDPKAVKALLEAKRAANAEAKKLRLEREALQAADKVKQDEALKEQGKYKELAETRKAEADAARAELTKATIDSRVELEALKQGAIDPEDVKQLVDRTNVKFSAETRTVDGVKDAVEALKKAKPHLFKGAGEQRINVKGKAEPRAPMHLVDRNPEVLPSGEDLIAQGLLAGKK